MRQHKKQSRVRGVDVAKIHNLMKKGYTTKDISEITGRSQSSINNYALVIDEILSGKPVHLSPDRYSVDAVKEWCEIIGKEFIPREEKPVQLEMQTERTIADVAEDISKLFHEFSEMWRCGK